MYMKLPCLSTVVMPIPPLPSSEVSNSKHTAVKSAIATYSSDTNMLTS